MVKIQPVYFDALYVFLAKVIGKSCHFFNKMIRRYSNTTYFLDILYFRHIEK